MLSFMVLYTNFAKGQNYYLYDPSIPGGAFNSFLQTNPFPSLTSTSCSLEVGKSFTLRPTRSIFYGGNLGVSQDISNYGNSGGKWSFIGSWSKFLGSGYSCSPPCGFSPGLNYLVNYHRWGDYSAHFGLRSAATSTTDGGTWNDGALKDAVITWGYEHGHTENRLVFQSFDGVDASGTSSMTEHEWATILSNGNIGSGTSAPGAQLDIVPNSTGSGPDALRIFNLTDHTNPRFKFTKTGYLYLGDPSGTTITSGTVPQILDVFGNVKIVTNSPTVAGTFALDVTGDANLLGKQVIQSPSGASGSFKVFHLKDNTVTPSPKDLFYVQNNGDVFMSKFALGGSSQNLFVDNTGKVFTATIPYTANTLWEMGGNTFTTGSSYILGSLSNHDIQVKAGNTLAYTVNGVSSTYRGFTEFNKPMSICTTANANWTLNLKSVGTTVGSQGVLNCVSTTGTSILQVDNVGNMYLPGIAPSWSGQSFVGIDATGQLSSMISSNGYWKSAGNTFTGSGSTYTFGSIAAADDKIEFFAGGNKVFDIWNNVPSTPTEEGSTNFCRNVSIQGGTTNTGFANGNGGLLSTSNSNNEYFSLNIRTAIDAGNTNYDTKGILRCVDGSNNNVVTVGAHQIAFFNGNTTFQGYSTIEYIDLMKSTLLGSNILTIWGKTKVKNGILPDRTIPTGVPAPTINLGGTGTGERFDNIYGTDLNCTNIIGNTVTTDALLPLNANTSNIGTPLQKFGIIYGNNIGDASNQFVEIYSHKTFADIFMPMTSGVSDIGDMSHVFDEIWGNNTYVDQLIPINPATSSSSGSMIGSISQPFATVYAYDHYVVVSDRKFKENIIPLNNSLDKVKRLNPVSYHLINGTQERSFGFIAQEINEVLPEVVSKDKKNDLSPLGVKYTELVPILTNAIQELSDKVDRLELQLQIKNSEPNISENSTVKSTPILYQNIPNPFSDNVIIPYFIPENTGEAVFVINDDKGSIIKKLTITQKGNSNIELDNFNVAKGRYFYYLIVDNKMIDVKVMIKK